MIAVRTDKAPLSQILSTCQIIVQEAIRDSFKEGVTKEDFRNECLQLSKLLRECQEKVERL